MYCSSLVLLWYMVFLFWFRLILIWIVFLYFYEMQWILLTSLSGEKGKYMIQSYENRLFVKSLKSIEQSDHSIKYFSVYFGQSSEIGVCVVEKSRKYGMVYLLISYQNCFYTSLWHFPRLDVLPTLTLLLNIGFHRASATGVACRQGTLTPPDTWSRPFGTCICSACWDQSFSELVVILPDYAVRISLGTFSILLYSIKLKQLVQVLFL